MIGLKVVMSDPAGKVSPFNDDYDIRNDPFAIIGAEFDINKYKIRWRLAKQFKKDSFQNVAMYLKEIKKRVKPNFMGMETNNNGKDILKLFHQKYKLNYIHGVTMSGELTAKTRQKGYAVDKGFIANWFKQKLDEGMMEFPNNPTGDMQAFIDQIPTIVSVPTPSGSVNYKAHRGQHDDLFVAGLHCCNIIRLFIEEQERLK
jgi:hypothetical protein